MVVLDVVVNCLRPQEGIIPSPFTEATVAAIGTIVGINPINEVFLGQFQSLEGYPTRRYRNRYRYRPQPVRGKCYLAVYFSYFWGIPSTSTYRTRNLYSVPLLSNVGESL